MLLGELMLPWLKIVQLGCTWLPATVVPGKSCSWVIIRSTPGGDTVKLTADTLLFSLVSATWFWKSATNRMKYVPGTSAPGTCAVPERDELNGGNSCPPNCEVSSWSAASSVASVER